MKSIKVNLIYIFLVSSLFGFAQTTTQDGDWITGATWGGSSPGYTGLNNPTVNHDVESASELTFASSNGRSLTVGTGGVLVVRGAIVFDVNKNNASITVESGATLIVFGSVELGKNNAGITVEAGGVVVVTDEITAAGNNGTISGDGKMYTPSTDLDDGGIGEGAVQPIDNLDGDGYGDIENYVDGGGADPLPVELLYFNSTLKNEVTLNWATATEINNDHFTIERSEDGLYFYKIGQVLGNGNSNDINEYSFVDKLVLAPVEYYRLKQTDYDGNFEYFQTKRVETNLSKEMLHFSFYPNSVTNGLLSISSNKPFEIKDLTISNISGQTVQNIQNLTTKENTLTFSTNLNSLKKGVYFLRMTSTAGDTKSSRIIIK